MNKIREAVIELDGKWPTKNKKDRYLLLCINSVGQVSTGQYDTGPSSKPCPIYWQVVGTRDEFNNEWDALISEGYVFGQGKPYKPDKAKPIQSPRDRAIEAADKAVSEHANFYCSVGETLWRAGLLRIPEDD